MSISATASVREKRLPPTISLVRQLGHITMLLWVLLVCVIGVPGCIAFKTRKNARFTVFALHGSSLPVTSQENAKTIIAKSTNVLIKSLGVALMYANAANAASVKGTTYLVEPTAEFKDEEKRTKELILAESKIRNQWDNAIEKLRRSETSIEKEANIRGLINVLNPLDGIPSGVQKSQLVKLCRSLKFVNPEQKRSKKTLPTWTKEVEIAYQELIQLYNKKMLPDNKNRANPL